MKPISTTVMLGILVMMLSACQQDAPPLFDFDYKNAYVRFNYDETETKTFGNLRGHLKGYVYPEWAEIYQLDEEDNVTGYWVIPRERIVYMGKELK